MSSFDSQGADDAGEDDETEWTTLDPNTFRKKWAEYSWDEQLEAWAEATEAERTVLRERLSPKTVVDYERAVAGRVAGGEAAREDGRPLGSRGRLDAIAVRIPIPDQRPSIAVRTIYISIAVGTATGYFAYFRPMVRGSVPLEFLGTATAAMAVVYIVTSLHAVRHDMNEGSPTVDRIDRFVEFVFRVVITAGLLIWVLIWGIDRLL